MANKHVTDKIIHVKQEEGEAQPKSVGVKRPRKDFDDSILREELKKRGVSAGWLDKHPNLAECGRRYKSKKVDATIVLTPVGVVVDISNPKRKEIDRTYKSQE